MNKAVADRGIIQAYGWIAWASYFSTIYQTNIENQLVKKSS
ncbi:hypothetical protein PQG22_01525 [Aquirufa beregesia]|nr:hypothetical protein [Aquirufa beregesia]